MDINLLIDKIELDVELKNKVLSLVKIDEAKLNSLCQKCCKDNFKSVFSKNDLVKLCVALIYASEYTYPIYLQNNIGDDIFFDTMKDISVWCENNNNKGLRNFNWIKNHLNFELFKLGRLQFQLYICNDIKLDYSMLPFDKGEPMVYVHIPQGEKLIYSDCVNSIIQAKEFFAKRFPHFNYRFFFCESWLLYGENWQFMDSSSNILQFSTLFDLVCSTDNDKQAIERIFGKRHIIKSKYPEKTTLQKNAKAFMQGGGKLGMGIGILHKDDI